MTIENTNGNVEVQDNEQSEMVLRHASARKWMLCRGYIHPKNELSGTQMNTEIVKLERLIEDSTNEMVVQAAGQWRRVYLRKVGEMEQERARVANMEFGEAVEKQTKGRSPAKKAKSEASREEYEEKQKNIPKRAKSEPSSSKKKTTAKKKT